MKSAFWTLITSPELDICYILTAKYQLHREPMPHGMSPQVILIKHLTIKPKLRICTVYKPLPQMVIYKCFKLPSVRLIRHGKPICINKHRSILILKIDSLKILIVELIHFHEHIYEIRIYPLLPVLLDISGIFYIASELVFSCEINLYPSYLSSNFNKPESWSVLAAFLSYVANLTGSHSCKSLKSYSKRNIRSILFCHRNQYLHNP